MIRAGRLRHLVVIEERQSTNGDPGDWVAISASPQMRCELTAEAASSESENPTSQVRWKIRARYRGDVNTGHRLVQADSIESYNAAGFVPERLMYIEGVQPLGIRENELSITALERDQ